MNAFTERVIRQAFEAGMTVYSDVEPYARTRRVIFDARDGVKSPFGVLRVAVHSGRITRGTFHYGNHGRHLSATSPTAVAHQMRRLCRYALLFNRPAECPCGCGNPAEPADMPDR